MQHEAGGAFVVASWQRDVPDMASEDATKAEASAEKAYAAATEVVGLTEAGMPAADVVPVAFPSKAKRSRKVSDAVPVDEPVKSVEATLVPEAKLAVAGKAAAKPVKALKRPAKAARRVVAKPASSSRKSVRPKPTARPATAKVVASEISTLSIFPPNFKFKDPTMDMSATFTEGFKNIFTDAQDKAKETFSKTTAAFGEYNDFAKGNVDAVVESGKILAAGLQDLGTNIVAESRSAFETLTADVKELTAVKSPSDFFKVQSDLFRKSFDSAVAQGSKNTEALLKLANEVVAPISGRVSLAVEKVRQAA